MFLPDRWLNSTEVKLYTDASGSIGYSAVLGSRWFRGNWDIYWRYQNVAISEFYPIVLAVQTWSKYIAYKCILFKTDNQALVHVINKQTANDKHMFLLRKLVLTCIEFNSYFGARHLSSKENLLCDYLSRSKVQRFLELATWAEQTSSRDTSSSTFSILIGVKGKLPALDISLEITHHFLCIQYLKTSFSSNVKKYKIG